MKKLLLLFLASLTMLFVGCSQFDDTRIWDAIDELEDLYDDLDGRVEDLEEACEKMNTNIEALQTLVTALQNHDTITSIAPIKQGDEIIGYTISFSKSEPITIYHGTDGKDGADGEDGKDGADGKDGYTPTIGVAQDEDGAYYWTLDGEWLLDENGNKIKAVGTDGKDGEDGANGNDGANGENGENGADGKDGITPQLEIRDGYWYISYDNGATWKELGKATGEDGKDGADGEDGKDGEDGTNGTDGQDGKDGDSLFQSVTWDEEYAYFTLADGTVITIPLSREAVNKPIEIIAKYYLAEYNGSWDDIHAYVIALTDTYNILEEKYDNEESNSNLYMIAIYTNEEPVTGVLPNGTYVLSTTYEAGTLSGVEGGECYIIRNGEWEEVYATDAVLVISDNKIDGTFTLENGEVHHVVYEGSLKLYEEGDEEDTTTPPANEIWYTSTDGEVVTPNATRVFGANIVSNTYENGKGVITFDGDVTSIGDSAFWYCSSLASVTIPDSVTSIGDCAFIGCSSLASITIPDGVTSIGVDAFAGCESLTSITIPEGVTSIGDSAFNNCYTLPRITIPESVTEVGFQIFWNCIELTEVYCKPTTPPAAVIMGDYSPPATSWILFDSSYLNIKIYVPEESVEAYKTADGWRDYADNIEGYDFENGGSGEDTPTPPANEIWYTSTDGEVVTPYNTDAFGVYIISNTYENGVGIITFDGDVTSIGEGAFAVCLSLASVTIPDSVTEIGNRAFKECSSLASVTIPDNVTSIGKEAFAGCESLVSATIPDSVTWIGDYAFLNCFSLTSITIPDSVTSIGEGAFAGCESLVSIVIPDSVTSIGRMAFHYCSSLAEFRGKFASEDGRCLIVDGVLNSFAPAGLNEYTIPDSVTSIGRMAFWYCSSLASVTIPDSVTEIEDYAFDDCYSLTYVYCKATTPPIMGYNPFYYTLANIYVPEGCVEAYKSADGWSQYAYAIKEYAPVNYASWLGSYTISCIGSVYDSEADSRVEREVEFTITVEAKDESSLSYNVTGWDGCPYPITAYYGSEDELILSAGMVVEGLDLGDGTYSYMGDLYCVGVLEGNQILVGGPIIKLSKDANQVVGITTDGNEVIGITFCFQAYEDGVFYLLKRYGLLYTPMDMAVSSGVSYAPKKAVAFGGRNSGIDRTRTLRVVK